MFGWLVGWFDWRKSKQAHEPSILVLGQEAHLHIIEI